MKKREKTFKFDVIIEEEDMCDREKEKKRLISIMKRKGRVVIYSMRRMGKTSLVNVCSKKLHALDHKFFYLYVDLNEVSDISELAGRFRSHFELALKEQMPLKKVKFYINEILSRLKINLPGGMELSLEKYSTLQPEEYLMMLFQGLKTIGADHEVVLIIDEFQGIAELSDVQATLRREVKKLSNAAIILMGSNQRLLYGMFNDKKSPFFGFGEDMELHRIPVSAYLPYMNERFASEDIEISENVAVYMMDKMNNIPNYINELGSWIIDNVTSGTELTVGHIDSAIESATRSKSGRYESALYGYNVNQKKFIRAVAKLGPIGSYTGKEMSEETGLSPTELNRVVMALEDAPLVTRDTNNNFFILDPFLKNFLLIV